MQKKQKHYNDLAQWCNNRIQSSIKKVLKNPSKYNFNWDDKVFKLQKTGPSKHSYILKFMNLNNKKTDGMKRLAVMVILLVDGFIQKEQNQLKNNFQDKQEQQMMSQIQKIHPVSKIFYQCLKQGSTIQKISKERNILRNALEKISEQKDSHWIRNCTKKKFQSQQQRKDFQRRFLKLKGNLIYGTKDLPLSNFYAQQQKRQYQTKNKINQKQKQNLQMQKQNMSQLQQLKEDLENNFNFLDLKKLSGDQQMSKYNQLKKSRFINNYKHNPQNHLVEDDAQIDLLSIESVSFPQIPFNLNSNNGQRQGTFEGNNQIQFINPPCYKRSFDKVRQREDFEEYPSMEIHSKLGDIRKRQKLDDFDQFQ